VETMAATPQYNGSRLEKRVDDYGKYLKIENEVKQRKLNKYRKLWYICIATSFIIIQHI